MGIESVDGIHKQVAEWLVALLVRREAFNRDGWRLWREAEIPEAVCGQIFDRWLQICYHRRTALMYLCSARVDLVKEVHWAMRAIDACNVRQLGYDRVVKHCAGHRMPASPLAG